MDRPSWRPALAVGMVAVAAVAAGGLLGIPGIPTGPAAKRGGAAVSQWANEVLEPAASVLPKSAETSLATGDSNATGAAPVVGPLVATPPAPVTLTPAPSLLIPLAGTPVSSATVTPAVTMTQSPVALSPIVPEAVRTIESIPTSRPIPVSTPGPLPPTAVPSLGGPQVGASTLPSGQPASLAALPPTVDPPATSPGVVAPSAPSAPSAGVVTTGPPVRESGTQIRVPARPGPIPRSLQIPDINLVAPIVPVGLEPSGILASPPGPDLVGWYAGGPRSGQPGNLLLDGHRDWHEGPRPAVFWSLDRLVPNQSQLVIWSEDQGFVYLVTENFRLHRDDPAGLAVLARTSDPTVTLITCEGRFEAASREYDDRRVVRGRLIGSLSR